MTRRIRLGIPNMSANSFVGVSSDDGTGKVPPYEIRAREAAGMLSQEGPNIGYRLGVIGTSLVQQNDLGSVVSQKLSHSSRGWLSWARVLSNGIFYCPVWYDETVYEGWEPSGVPGSTRGFRGLNAGVSGQTYLQIDARKTFFNFIDCDIIVIDMGTNDVGNTSADTLVAYREQIANYYLSLGKIVILLPILARATSQWASGTISRDTANYVNRKTREFCFSRRNCYLFDWNASWVDMSQPTDTIPFSTYTDDGTHFIPPGGYFVGKAFAAFLATILPPAQPRVWGQDDKFNANNAFGNILVNPFLYGNSGAVGTAASGNVANGMRVERSSGGSTVTAVKELRPDGRGYWQNLTFSISGSNTDLFYFRTNAANTTHGLTGNDIWVQASCVVNSSAYPWRGVSLYLQDQTANGITAYGMEPYPTASASANNWQGTEGWQGLITTPAYRLQPGSTDVRWRLEIRIDANQAGSPTLKVGEVELRRVANTIAQLNATI